MGGKGEQPGFFDDLDDGYDMRNASDPEKYEYYQRNSSNEYERRAFPSSYSTSSRETSGSFQPMLHKVSKKRKTPNYTHRLPHRTIRYLCLALISAVIIFILSLVQMSWMSARQLEMGTVEKQAPKPPPWESFDFLKRYFGGVRFLVKRDENVPEYPGDPGAGYGNATALARERRPLPKSVGFDPYPNYNSASYRAKYEEKHVCYLDQEEQLTIPKVHYYVGVPQGFPDPVMGSYDVLGLRDDICFERFGRLGPYGYGYSVQKGGTGAGLNGDREGADDIWSEVEGISEVNYLNVQWAQAQHACALKNKKRFKPTPETNDHLFQNMRMEQKKELRSRAEVGEGTRQTESGGRSAAPGNETLPLNANSKPNVTLLPRTAVLIRTWWDLEYTTEDILYLRSLITELSLLSGGEFTLHFLVHVRDDNVPIWADKRIYNRVLENSLPKEFQGMGSLWSERQMSLIYGGLEESFIRNLPVHGVYRGTFLPVQYFSYQHPEYEYIWNWEMDVRYTGQWYHLFDRVREWTKAQPRKGLWERNGRFYIPSVHGSWEDFRQMVRVQTEMGTDSPNNMWSGVKSSSVNAPGSGVAQGKSDTPVWGPLSPPDMLGAQEDPLPPTTVEKDKYEWGVGEEADLITFNPLFDPDGTTWFFTEDVTGFNTTEGLPPRRAAITTTSRLSRRLLQTMHRETMLKRHTMFSEMWPASCALHHGFKAVYAPHPVYIDRDWPTSYLASVMNGGRNGASGGARTSAYGGREHNFRGTSWFYDAGFSPNLWRRWLGYKVDNDGGEQEELAGEGRMCLPGIFLHPIKSVKMVVEGIKQVPEKDQMEMQGNERAEDEGNNKTQS
ncbi:hypothetical protein MMC07_003697 [Pseudocyphellaria aurata]|nr:hypothetical protein [Pseudocyphellaria aurata]